MSGRASGCVSARPLLLSPLARSLAHFQANKNNPFSSRSGSFASYLLLQLYLWGRQMLWRLLNEWRRGSGREQGRIVEIGREFSTPTHRPQRLQLYLSLFAWPGNSQLLLMLKFKRSYQKFCWKFDKRSPVTEWLKGGIFLTKRLKNPSFP